MIRKERKCEKQRERKKEMKEKERERKKERKKERDGIEERKRWDNIPKEQGANDVWRSHLLRLS